ncbi:MAG: hypothetical protein R2826_01830 [Thermoleophilia bacterium]
MTTGSRAPPVEEQRRDPSAGATTGALAPSLGADGSYAISVDGRHASGVRTEATTAGSLTGYSPIATLTVAARQPWEVTSTSGHGGGRRETVTYTGRFKRAPPASGSGAVVIQKRRRRQRDLGHLAQAEPRRRRSYAISVAMTTADRQWEFRTVMATTAGSLTGYSLIATLTVAARQRRSPSTLGHGGGRRETVTYTAR